MKVLWFSNTSSNYGVNNAYNGGGWISSLETELSRLDDMLLGICFWHTDQQLKSKKGSVSYYPLYNEYSSAFGKIRKFFKSSKKILDQHIAQYLQVIDDFQPDVITVFGTEQDFGLITPYIKIPVVIYIQGILNSCVNAFFPPGVSLVPYVLADINPIHIKTRFRDYQIMRQNAKRELEIFKYNQYFIGRTTWDRLIVSTFSKNAQYFHCNEILRSEFYVPFQRNIPKQLVITSTLSAPLYKGIDMVFKTAKILQEFFNVPFMWNVYGNLDTKAVERMRDFDKDSIVFKGVATAKQLVKALQDSTVYVHTSYIENSPNSLCEAQMLGCPVVAQNVGGISSLVEHEKNGYLVPANDPLIMAGAIYDLFVDKQKNLMMGENAKQGALYRHDKSVIVNSIFQLYSHLTVSPDK